VRHARIARQETGRLGKTGRHGKPGIQTDID
jgi:hypothetical protein